MTEGRGLNLVKKVTYFFEWPLIRKSKIKVTYNTEAEKTENCFTNLNKQQITKISGIFRQLIGMSSSSHMDTAPRRQWQ